MLITYYSRHNGNALQGHNLQNVSLYPNNESLCIDGASDCLRCRLPLAGPAHATSCSLTVFNEPCPVAALVTNVSGMSHECIGDKGLTIRTKPGEGWRG